MQFENDKNLLFVSVSIEKLEEIIENYDVPIASKKIEYLGKKDFFLNCVDFFFLKNPDPLLHKKIVDVLFFYKDKSSLEKLQKIYNQAKDKKLKKYIKRKFFILEQHGLDFKLKEHCESLKISSEPERFYKFFISGLDYKGEAEFIHSYQMSNGDIWAIVFTFKVNKGIIEIDDFSTSRSFLKKHLQKEYKGAFVELSEIEGLNFLKKILKEYGQENKIEKYKDILLIKRTENTILRDFEFGIDELESMGKKEEIHFPEIGNFVIPPMWHYGFEPVKDITLSKVQEKYKDKEDSIYKYFEILIQKESLRKFLKECFVYFYLISLAKHSKFSGYFRKLKNLFEKLSIENFEDFYTFSYFVSNNERRFVKFSKIPEYNSKILEYYEKRGWR